MDSDFFWIITSVLMFAALFAPKHGRENVLPASADRFLFQTFIHTFFIPNDYLPENAAARLRERSKLVILVYPMLLCGTG